LITTAVYRAFCWVALIHGPEIIFTLHGYKLWLSLNCSEIGTAFYSGDEIVARDFGVPAILSCLA
jgi:hypothetical protein